MEPIEAHARLSVARGSGFGALAIVCTMVGLSGTPAIAFKTGGILCLLACFILLAKAERAPKKPYKRTEVWLMLEDRLRPPSTVAQRLISGALRIAYRDFALHFARVAALSLGLALVLALVGG